jgi:peptidoglycan LD-endopeptidase LytH
VVFLLLIFAVAHLPAAEKSSRQWRLDRSRITEPKKERPAPQRRRAPEEPANLPDNSHALNPTGGPVRFEGMDAWGGGEYLSRRNDREARGLSVHHAIDYVGAPGQKVIAPISGFLRRYGSGEKAGAILLGKIGGEKHKVKLLHFTVTVPDGLVTQGQVIGHVKDLGRYYPGMTSHVHMEVHRWEKYSGYRVRDPGIVVREPQAAEEN